jgi:hypothetical protein
MIATALMMANANPSAVRSESHLSGQKADIDFRQFRSNASPSIEIYRMAPDRT